MKRLLVLIMGLSLLFGIFTLALAEEDITTYEELVKYGETYNITSGTGTIPIKVEAVIGDIKTEKTSLGTDTLFDLWIKGEDIYYFSYKKTSTFMKEYNFPHELISGLRVIYEVLPYSDGSFGGQQILSYTIVEEGVDYKSLEEEYKSKAFEEITSYKKLLRNIEDYSNLRVSLIGNIFQDLGYDAGKHEFLVMDEEANIYYISYYDDYSRVNDRLLLDDKIKIYGKISSGSPTYEYVSLTGNRTVPSIFVEFIDLLEDE